MSKSEEDGTFKNHRIDYQSDTSNFGRGEMHLSAALNEGDVVVYQTGTWEVDGVEVGNGNPALLEYCIVETMQVVWTHNCEHGFIRGMAVTIENHTQVNQIVQLISPLEFVDFGPEQLIARIPIEWLDEEEGKLLVPLPDILQNPI